MDIQSVWDVTFKRYGQVMEGYDFQELIEWTKIKTPLPQDGVIYVPSDAQLEALSVASAIQTRGMGGLPVQIGYCNGVNGKLNCVEYHRSSELDIAATDAILLLGWQADFDEYTLDTAKIEAFFLPAGTGVELFAMTLHYAPCSAEKGQGFQVIVVLPKGTNTDKPTGFLLEGEDRLAFGLNKWVVAHPEAVEAKQGAFVGLTGKNIDLYG